MTLDVYLSIFTLLFISLGVNVLALKFRIPYTVLLVIAGSFLVPLAELEFFSFITSFQLTPELLFFVFLPVLIFESAYNIKLRNIRENKFPIAMLAVVGLLVSTLIIGYAGHWGFKLIGFEVPILVTLLFGAIISATDPVAVLALFKEFGAPHRLTLIFEGESLFNDGTAFAIFLVLLDVINHGYQGYSTWLQACLTFFTMMIGGTLFGLLMGLLFSKLIEKVKSHHDLEITLTLLVAHLTFLLAELISEKVVIYGFPLHLSSIIATLVSSIVLGNYGRFKMSSTVEEYMEKFWSYFAFVANSLVFILMGLLFTSLTISLHIALLPILMMILVVVIARAISIYFSVAVANAMDKEGKIPANWQHLMAWGSLRGSLAVIMVLLIPDDLSMAGWSYDYSVKELIAALTIGCIYFTLLVKANTIGPMVHWLKIDKLMPYEQLSYYKSKAMIYMEIINHAEKLLNEQQINQEQFERFSNYYRSLHTEIGQQCNKLDINSRHVIENMLRIYTLSIQKKMLKQMFRNDEINENIYKKNLLILETQTERVEQDKSRLTSLNAYLTGWYMRIMQYCRQIFFSQSSDVENHELYFYYRTQFILISNVLNELYNLQKSCLAEVFDDSQAIHNVILIYKKLLTVTEEQMKNKTGSNNEALDLLNEASAVRLLQTVQMQTLHGLHENEIITRKLYIILDKELNHW